MPSPDSELVQTVLQQASAVAQRLGLKQHASKFQRFHKRFQSERPTYKALREDVEPVRNDLAIKARDLLLDEWRKPRVGMEASSRDYDAVALALCHLIYPPEPQMPEMNIARFSGAKHVEEKVVSYEGARAGVRPVVEHAITLIRQYSQAVGAGDFQAAYALTDSGLQGWMSPRKFVAAHDQAAREWDGPALEYHIGRFLYVYADDAARAKSNTSLEGWPKGTPKANRRTAVSGFWIRDRSAQTGCGGSLWIAEEDGEYRIAKFNFYMP